VTGDGAHTHSATTDAGGVDHNHSYNATTIGAGTLAGGGSNPQPSVGGSTTGTSSAFLHTHPVTIGSSGTHGHDVGGTTDGESGHVHQVLGDTGNVSASHSHSVSGNTGNTGSGTAHNNVPGATLGTWFIKL
jgi:hypothetical protein